VGKHDRYWEQPPVDPAAEGIGYGEGLAISGTFLVGVVVATLTVPGIGGFVIGVILGAWAAVLVARYVFRHQRVPREQPRDLL